MTARRRPSTPSLGMQLDVLFARRLVICAICGEVIERRKDCQWDHTFEHADGGPNMVDNLRPVHNHLTGGCHKRKSARAERDRHHIDRIVKKLALPAAAPTEPVSPTPQEDIGSVGERPRSRWAPRKMNRRAKPNIRQINEETI
jgi:hypothetical protein